MLDYKTLLNYLENLSIDELVNSVSISMKLSRNGRNPIFSIFINIKFNNRSIELLTIPDLLKNYNNVSSCLSIVYYNMYMNEINETFRKYAQTDSLGNYLMKKHANLSDEWKLYEKVDF